MTTPMPDYYELLNQVEEQEREIETLKAEKKRLREIVLAADALALETEWVMAFEAGVAVSYSPVDVEVALENYRKAREGRGTPAAVAPGQEGLF